MLYQLPNGKVIYLSVDQYLDLTDLDIQYLMSIDYGEHIINPFADSAISKNTKEKYYDFDYVFNIDYYNKWTNFNTALLDKIRDYQKYNL